MKLSRYSHVWCFFGIVVGTNAVATELVFGAVSHEKAASTMQDLQSHFANCFKPPQSAAGSLITFYFLLNSAGDPLGSPRIVWRAAARDAIDRQQVLSLSRDAFKKCLPLQMERTLASTIPGKVYFLQFAVAKEDTTELQALFRPFGSHGYPLVHQRR